MVRVDGQSVYVIASPGDGKTLVVRHVSVEPKEWRVSCQVQGSFPFRLPHASIEEERPITVRESKVSLPSPLWGTPALVGSHLVLPMANEKIARLPLPLPEVVNDVQTGFDWKSVRATPEERGHVLALGGDRFLTTDGLRQLRSWEWPAEGTFKPLPAARGGGPKLALADRVVVAPVMGHG